jgi:tRNA A-37 threonylcarbamoyl transferase component Bud32/tetratricopeptide (TPR) repeat protein
MAKPDKPQSHADAQTRETSASAMTPTIEDSAMPVRLPDRIGKYHIKRVIAAGGMGVVYEAMQDTPRRSVALKIMKQGIASRSALRRFEYESQILARLRHPGIAQVYEAGMHDDGTGGVPFFAMEYIAGARDIVDFARSKELSVRERLELFDKVCDAIHHGHQKGIIHRDLKPANILVDSTGQPRIIDFGVARATDSDLAVPTLQTDVGQLVGTVQYMSPEQIAADPHDIDTRSDVYALGVVLYKTLTDQLPYDVSGTVIYEATRMVREQAPRRLSSINRVLRGDVETIVMHALEKDRDRRYQSAIELAADIRRYLSNRPILARPPSLAYNFRTYLKRNKVVVTGLVGIFAALVLGIITTTWQRGVAVEERDRAEFLFGQVRGLARTFLFDFFDEIKFLDGSLPARKLLVTSALEYLDNLAEGAPDNVDLMHEVGRAYNRVGDIQGGFRNPSLGDTEGALASYRRAMEILQGLAAAAPPGIELLDDLAATHTRIGDVLINTNNVSGALEAYTRGLEIRETMTEDVRHGRLLSFSLNAVGGALLQMGRLSEAAAHYDRALQISQKIASLEPGDTIGSSAWPTARSATSWWRPATTRARSCATRSRRASGRPSWRRIRPAPRGATSPSPTSSSGSRISGSNGPSRRSST